MGADQGRARARGPVQPNGAGHGAAAVAGGAAGRRPCRPPSGAGLEAFVPALARVVPEWGDAADDASPLVLGEAVLRLLSSWASPNAGLLVVLEDLHWADPESLEVLEYVIDNLAGTPCWPWSRRCATASRGAGADLAADLLTRRAASSSARPADRR